MKFELFFFKENTRTYDVEALINLILSDSSFSLRNADDRLTLKYSNQIVKLDYSFNFTKASRVPDINRVSPKFLDLDFYVEFDVLLPTYKLNLIINTIENVCRTFGLSIYHVWFEDVSAFSKTLITDAYDKVRLSYKDQFPLEYKPLKYISKDKLEAYYRYTLEGKATNEYYNNQYYFLDLYFVENLTYNRVKLATELKLESSIIIPPFVDVIVIEKNGKKSYYDYDAVFQQINKYTKEFPGFIGNAVMIEEKNIKKVVKVITKMKLNPTVDRIEKISEESLVDF